MPGASFAEIIERCQAYKAEAQVDVICPNTGANLTSSPWRARTSGVELTEMLASVGFVDVRAERTFASWGIVTGAKEP